MTELKSIDEFLDEKKDYSPFLVHLTKDGEFPAKDVLDTILSEKTLKAFKHFCLFSPNLKKQSSELQDKFRVVCFTETPIDQIHVLLTELGGRDFKPKPYGLVFKKEYISKNDGNHVFYVTKKIAKPLWQLYFPICDEGAAESPDQVCKLLALVTVCEKLNDWHWEREWRIVGNFRFKLEDIYCGFCPEEDIEYFELKYQPVKFISPNWSETKILAKGVGK
jgi:hypothetical protein